MGKTLNIPPSPPPHFTGVKAAPAGCLGGSVAELDKCFPPVHGGGIQCPHSLPVSATGYQQPKLNSGLYVFIEFPYLVRLSQDIDWPLIRR